MAKQYTIDQQRDIAIGATQSYLRRMDIEPSTLTGDDAFSSLGDFSRGYPDRIAAEFYRNHSNAQYNKFVRQWNKWAAKERNELAYQTWAKGRGYA